MAFFKKKIKFTSAVCPKCNGNLELDSNLKTAFCKNCGAQCIVENAPKKENKTNTLEMVMDFFERQQTLYRKDKEEKKQEAELEEKKKSEHFKKWWKVYLAITITFFAFIMIMAILEKQGII